MTSQNTTRVSLRLKNDVHGAILRRAEDAGLDPSAYMQDILEKAVIEDLPEDLRLRIERERALYEVAQRKARDAFAEGAFDEHFTRTVFRLLVEDNDTRRLYEDVIGAEAGADGAPGKTPVNMYLGWYIKNAIGAKPLLGPDGNPRRAFVKGEPIKSYTLLTME
ncbi:hypothetical protein [Mesorhizobium sp. 128a]